MPNLPARRKGAGLSFSRKCRWSITKGELARWPFVWQLGNVGASPQDTT
jgi:hypothetical protein